MRRILWAVTGAVLMAALAAGVVFALNYEGEDFCQESPAWPNGTYLGQMHPYHSDFYRGYAERRGWDPCVTWATDQRNSAIRGLRELGYTVTAPDAPAPVPDDSNLQTTTRAGMWLSVVNTDAGRLEVQVLIISTSVVVDTFGLHVDLFAGRRHVGELCNTSKVFGGEWSANLGCPREKVQHSEVTHANVAIGNTDIRCERNTVTSTADETILACEGRE